MMRVLDDGPMRDPNDDVQLVRGALLYVRQNWWIALCLCCFAARAVHELIAENDGRSLMMYSFTALLLAFWWTYDPVVKRSGFRPEVEIGPASGFSFGVIFGAFDLGFFLLLTCFAMAWPWILRTTGVQTFNVWVVVGVAISLWSIVLYYAFFWPQ